MQLLVSLTLQHLITSHTHPLFKYLREEKVSMQTAPTTITRCSWNVAQIVTLSKAGVSFAFGVGVWCKNKPNQRCLSPIHPKERVQVEKASSPILPPPLPLLCSTSTAPPAVARMLKRTRRFLSWALLPFSDSLFTPCSWRPRWERSGCRRRMGGACSLCSSNSTWARRGLEDTRPACSDTPAGEGERFVTEATCG